MACGLITVARQLPAAAADPPDLLVVKTPVANPVAGAFRTTIGWTISWSCASIESPCNNAQITDTLPAGSTLKVATTTGGLVKSANVVGNTVTWQLETPDTPGVLDAGAIGTLTVTASVPCNAAADQTFTNTATMSASNAVAPYTSDPSPITVTAAANCDPPPPPPPSKSSPARAECWRTASLFLTLPYAPGAYELVDPVPAGLEFRRVTVGAPATVAVSCDGGSNYETVDFASTGPVGACVKSGGMWNVTHTKFAVPAQTDPGWGEDQTYVSATISTKVPASTPVDTVFTNTTETAGPVTAPLTASGTVIADAPFPRDQESDRHTW